MEKLTQTNYVDLAEQVISEKIERTKRGDIKLTTSKIRNLLSLVNNLYNETSSSNSDELDDDIKAQIQYVRLRFVYEAGREKDVKDFVEKANILNHIKKIETRDDLILFCRYMEALVAYHRFCGGKDK